MDALDWFEALHNFDQPALEWIWEIMRRLSKTSGWYSDSQFFCPASLMIGNSGLCESIQFASSDVCFDLSIPSFYIEFFIPRPEFSQLIFG